MEKSYTKEQLENIVGIADRIDQNFYSETDVRKTLEELKYDPKVIDKAMNQFEAQLKMSNAAIAIENRIKRYKGVKSKKHKLKFL